MPSAGQPVLCTVHEAVRGISVHPPLCPGGSPAPTFLPDPPDVLGVAFRCSIHRLPAGGQVCCADGDALVTAFCLRTDRRLILWVFCPTSPVENYIYSQSPYGVTPSPSILPS